LGLKEYLTNGFNNLLVLSKLDDNDINETEEFSRDVLPDLIDTAEYPHYYGLFKNNVKNIKF